MHWLLQPAIHGRAGLGSLAAESWRAWTQLGVFPSPWTAWALWGCTHAGVPQFLNYLSSMRLHTCWISPAPELLELYEAAHMLDFPSSWIASALWGCTHAGFPQFLNCLSSMRLHTCWISPAPELLELYAAAHMLDFPSSWIAWALWGCTHAGFPQFLNCLSSMRLHTCWIYYSSWPIHDLPLASLHPFSSLTASWSGFLGFCIALR